MLNEVYDLNGVKCERTEDYENKEEKVWLIIEEVMIEMFNKAPTCESVLQSDRSWHFLIFGIQRKW